MRFHRGAIPDLFDHALDKHWKSLREPTPVANAVPCAPIGFISVAAIALLWRVITPLGTNTLTVTPGVFLLSVVGVVLVPELIHACVHPMSGCSPQSIFGFWPSRVIFYTHYVCSGSHQSHRLVLLR